MPLEPRDCAGCGKPLPKAALLDPGERYCQRRCLELDTGLLTEEQAALQEKMSEQGKDNGSSWREAATVSWDRREAAGVAQ